MKYIERLKVEHPEFISDKFIRGCEGCPEDYGYEPYSNTCPSGSEQLSVEEACRRCWRREIPTEKPDWRQDMLRKFDRRE